MIALILLVLGVWLLVVLFALTLVVGAKRDDEEIKAERRRREWKIHDGEAA